MGNSKILSKKKQNTQTEKLLTEKELQTNISCLQSVLNVSEEQTIHNKADLKLYLHFQKLLGDQEYHCNKKSIYYQKKVSRQKIVSETIKYLNSLKQNINPKPPQHYHQLIFLVDLFDSSKKLITNFYYIDQDNKKSNFPQKMHLAFGFTLKRIDMKQFLRFDNWNHLVVLSFYHCCWFNDDDWKELVKHADNFNNLKWLGLTGNGISKIKEGDIKQFKALQSIDLYNNPLSKQTKVMLKMIKTKGEIKILFTDRL